MGRADSHLVARTVRALVMGECHPTSSLVMKPVKTSTGRAHAACRLALRAASPLSRNSEAQRVLPNAYTKLAFSSKTRR